MIKKKFAYIHNINLIKQKEWARINPCHSDQKQLTSIHMKSHVTYIIHSCPDITLPVDWAWNANLLTYIIHFIGQRIHKYMKCTNLFTE